MHLCCSDIKLLSGQRSGHTHNVKESTCMFVAPIECEDIRQNQGTMKLGQSNL